MHIQSVFTVSVLAALGSVTAIPFFQAPASLIGYDNLPGFTVSDQASAEQSSQDLKTKYKFSNFFRLKVRDDASDDSGTSVSVSVTATGSPTSTTAFATFGNAGNGGSTSGGINVDPVSNSPSTVAASLSFSADPAIPVDSTSSASGSNHGSGASSTSTSVSVSASNGPNTSLSVSVSAGNNAEPSSASLTASLISANIGSQSNIGSSAAPSRSMESVSNSLSTTAMSSSVTSSPVSKTHSSVQSDNSNKQSSASNCVPITSTVTVTHYPSSCSPCPTVCENTKSSLPSLATRKYKAIKFCFCFLKIFRLKLTYKFRDTNVGT